MRAWGLYLIPRDKAPDEGFLLTYTKKGGSVPFSQVRKNGGRWRAWWLPHGPESDAPHYRAGNDVVELVDELTEDHIL